MFLLCCDFHAVWCVSATGRWKEMEPVPLTPSAMDLSLWVTHRPTCSRPARSCFIRLLSVMITCRHCFSAVVFSRGLIATGASPSPCWWETNCLQCKWKRAWAYAGGIIHQHKSAAIGKLLKGEGGLLVLTLGYPSERSFSKWLWQIRYWLWRFCPHVSLARTPTSLVIIIDLLSVLFLLMVLFSVLPHSHCPTLRGCCVIAQGHLSSKCWGG